ncbi:MAG: hypothetical protein ACRDNW_09130, partial [Trebonia sp.]
PVPRARLSVRAGREPRGRPVIAEVLGTPGRVAAFLAVAGVAASGYTLLLPFAQTQRLSFGNWGHLTGSQLAWAIPLSLGMALVVIVQAHAMRKVAAARAATTSAGGLAVVVSLLPTLLCCTPVVPSLLAFAGVSGLGLDETTGSVQYFFAAHETGFLAAGLALLAVTSWWGLRKVARAACLSGDGCAVPSPDREGTRP